MVRDHATSSALTPTGAAGIDDISSDSADSTAFSIGFIAATVALTSVTYGFGRYGYGLFLPAMREQFGATTLVLGAIASVNTAVYLISTIVASTFAIYFRPRTLMVGAGVITVSGLIMVGFSNSLVIAATGVIVAGIGGGMLSPALFEAIEAWLPARWRTRAIGALSAGATPGLVMTGLAAYWVQESWQKAWLVMSVIGGLVIIWNLFYLPARDLDYKSSRPVLKLRPSLFLRQECFPLYVTLGVYGILLSIYLTFSVDLIVNAGGIAYPKDRLFWVLLGIAGIPASLSGVFIARFGVRALLLVTLPMCGVSYLLLAWMPDNLTVILISSALFGFSSIAPGGALLVWCIGLFKERPSIGSGVVFFTISIAMIVGPMLSGVLEPLIGMERLFLALAVLTITLVPLFPRDIHGTESP